MRQTILIVYRPCALCSVHLHGSVHLLASSLKVSLLQAPSASGEPPATLRRTRLPLCRTLGEHGYPPRRPLPVTSDCGTRDRPEPVWHVSSGPRPSPLLTALPLSPDVTSHSPGAHTEFSNGGRGVRPRGWTLRPVGPQGSHSQKNEKSLDLTHYFCLSHLF